MSAAAPARPAHAPRLRFSGLLRSEAVKLGSLRSTRTAAVLLVLLVVAGEALRALAYSSIRDAASLGVSSEQAWRNVLDLGTGAGQVPAVVLAVLAVGSEYVQRSAATTFTAAPRRTAVLGAKALVVVAAVAALTAIGLTLGTAAAAPLLAATPVGAPAPDALATGAAEVLTLAVYTAFAVAVTAIVRSTAAGLAIVLGVLLVLPVAVSLSVLLTGVDLTPYLLSYAAPVSLSVLHDPAAAGDLLRALPVTLAWLVLPGAAAAVALERRDV